MSYQITIKGENIIVKYRNIFHDVIALLAKDDFESMTIERMKEDE